MSGAVLAATDTQIVLKSFAATRPIAKQDIATVDYIRQKPVTDGEEYIAEEAPILLFFAPMTYVRAAGISAKLQVRIYDASKLEDDTALVCKPSKP
jgi:hypothetical protein